jgi:hypothetical protein
MPLGSIPGEIVGFLQLTFSPQPRHGQGRRPASKADNVTVIFEQIVWKCSILDVSQPCEPPRPVAGITLSIPFFLMPLPPPSPGHFIAFI